MWIFPLSWAFGPQFLRLSNLNASLSAFQRSQTLAHFPTILGFRTSNFSGSRTLMQVFRLSRDPGNLHISSQQQIYMAQTRRKCTPKQPTYSSSCLHQKVKIHSNIPTLLSVLAENRITIDLERGETANQERNEAPHHSIIFRLQSIHGSPKFRQSHPAP